MAKQAKQTKPKKISRYMKSKLKENKRDQEFANVGFGGDLNAVKKWMKDPIKYDSNGNVIGYIIDGKYVSDKDVIERRKKRNKELGL